MSKIQSVLVCLLMSGLLALSIVLPASAAGLDDVPSLRPWTGDLDGMKKRRIVRILVPYSKTIYFIDKGRQYGTAVEMGQALEAWLNEGKTKHIDKVIVAFVPTPRDSLLPALVQGLGDIVAANLTVTPERQQIVDFTDPLLRGVKEVLVTGPTAPSVSGPHDLSGKQVFVRRSSSYWTHLEAINAKLKSEGISTIDVQAIDEDLEDEDLMEMVNAGLLPWSIVDDHKAKLWSKVFRNITVREDVAFSENGDIAGALRKDSPLLLAELNRFVAKHKVGTTFGNILAKRYMRDDKMLRKAYAPADLEKFKKLLTFFEKYGATYSFDDILLAAQGYQESQLDQSRRSPRGAVGVMQLLPTTASDKSVGIQGIDKSEERNIEAGAKYLRHLIDTYVKDDAEDDLNSMLFALAAYNAGPGNLRKFRRKAEELGLSQTRWFGNVENGAAEIVGRETVQYVGNIYKYYVAYKLYQKQAAANVEAKKSLVVAP